MNYYKMQIELRSGLGTLLAADTLFGHLCWSIIYREGEVGLHEFLDSYETDNPAIVLSDPFPEGFLPMPYLPLLAEQRSKLREKISKTKNIDNTMAAGELKKLAKMRWVCADAVTKCNTSLSIYDLLEKMIDLKQPKEITQKLVVHNAINRFSNTVEEGSLFFTQEYFVDSSEPPVFDVYLLSSFDKNKLAEMFEACFELGYGKYKSRGKGAISLKSIEQISLPTAENSNAAICLSSVAPAKEDPVNGFWQLNFKQGKLGGHWANGPAPGDEKGENNPFKYPLVTLKSGSVLFDDSPKPFYGRLIENVHPTAKEVRHYGLALTMPVNIDMEAIK